MMLFGLFTAAAIESAAADQPSAEIVNAAKRGARRLPGRRTEPVSRSAAGGGPNCQLPGAAQGRRERCLQAGASRRQDRRRGSGRGRARYKIRVRAKVRVRVRSRNRIRVKAPGQSPGQGQGQAQGKGQGPSVPSAAGPSTSEHYFLMKRVQIADQGNKVPAAVDVMIPTTWQFQGSISVMVEWGLLCGLGIGLHSRAERRWLDRFRKARPTSLSQYADDPRHGPHDDPGRSGLCQRQPQAVPGGAAATRRGFSPETDHSKFHRRQAGHLGRSLSRVSISYCASVWVCHEGHRQPGSGADRCSARTPRIRSRRTHLRAMGYGRRMDASLPRRTWQCL